LHISEQPQLAPSILPHRRPSLGNCIIILTIDMRLRKAQATTESRYWHQNHIIIGIYTRSFDLKSI